MSHKVDPNMFIQRRPLHRPQLDYSTGEQALRPSAFLSLLWLMNFLDLAGWHPTTHPFHCQLLPWIAAVAASRIDPGRLGTKGRWVSRAPADTDMDEVVSSLCGYRRWCYFNCWHGFTKACYHMEICQSILAVAVSQARLFYIFSYS